jgi:hypothetical protein
MCDVAPAHPEMIRSQNTNRNLSPTVPKHHLNCRTALYQFDSFSAVLPSFSEMQCHTVRAGVGERSLLAGNLRQQAAWGSRLQQTKQVWDPLHTLLPAAAPVRRVPHAIAAVWPGWTAQKVRGLPTNLPPCACPAAVATMCILYTNSNAAAAAAVCSPCRCEAQLLQGARRKLFAAARCEHT